MEISLLLMQQIAELFLMIFMGYVIVKAGLLKGEDSKVISKIVLYLIIPCVIINAFQVDYTSEKVQGLLLAFAASVMLQVVLLVIVWTAGHLMGLNEVEKASGSFYFKELPSFRSGGRHDAAGSLLFSKDPAAALLHDSDVRDRYRNRIRSGADRFPFRRCIPAFSVLGKVFAASPDPGTPVFSGADSGARRDLSFRTRNLCGNLRHHTLHLCDHD